MEGFTDSLKRPRIAIHREKCQRTKRRTFVEVVPHKVIVTVAVQVVYCYWCLLEWWLLEWWLVIIESTAAFACPDHSARANVLPMWCRAG